MQTWTLSTGRGKIQILLYEINQEFESERLQLQQTNQRPDQAQRNKISLYGGYAMRKRLFQEHQAKDCQEIDELRIICCEETDRARQIRIDELSVHQERNPTTVSQILTQIQELQNKVNSLSDARKIFDQRAALEHPTFSVNPLLFRVPEPCLAAILDSRMIHGILWVLQKTFLNNHLLEKDHPQVFSRSRTLAPSSRGLGPSNARNFMEHGRGGGTRAAEFVNTNPTSQSRSWDLESFVSYWRNLFSQWCDGLPAGLSGISKLKSQLQDWSMF